MLTKCARLLFPEIRISFHGLHAEAFINRTKVYFDFNCGTQDGTVFFEELVRLRQTYLKYALVKPKLVIEVTRASGDKTRLKESLEKAIHKFDHLLAGFIDGNKKMIL